MTSFGPFRHVHPCSFLFFQVKKLRYTRLSDLTKGIPLLKGNAGISSHRLDSLASPPPPRCAGHRVLCLPSPSFYHGAHAVPRGRSEGLGVAWPRLLPEQPRSLVERLAPTHCSSGLSPGARMQVSLRWLHEAPTAESPHWPAAGPSFLVSRPCSPTGVLLYHPDKAHDWPRCHSQVPCKHFNALR